ncbi:hypothetical protein VM1G_06638 [Cytospora mali]|uniref:Wings apart-like protein C-terminal domain-containing protein n=1 Tax=Cytospora mali TaxID=578113 RepID=A0A194W639_CYTMA|nr:hypothetical protein VM1G_06638 [Valsa mali]
MAARNNISLANERRITTYSKAFGRRPAPEEKTEDGRSCTAPLESSTVWDFQDDDEINSPFVTLPTKSKLYGRKAGNIMRNFPGTPSRPSSTSAFQPKDLPNPKRRRLSPVNKEFRGGRARSYSTPPSPPPSLPSPSEQLMPPSKTVPQSARIYSSGTTKAPTKGAALKAPTSRPTLFPSSIPINVKVPSLSKPKKVSEQKKEMVQTHIPFRPVQTPPSVPVGLPDFGTPAAVPSTPEPKIPKKFARPGSATKRTGPKITYSARRTIRAEGPSAGSLEPVDEDAWLKESLLPTGGSRFDLDDDEDEPFASGAVRSIHELRQAGANSRFADEIEDLLGRVGRPTGKTLSSRRNALVDLSQKLSDKSFVRKFRDHNGDRSLFEQVGKETDIIAGYALVAILTMLLATTASAHIISQLQNQGLSSLLERLLAIQTDIQPISKEKASNLSKHGQQSMSKLKSSLLILPIWDPTTPFMLSPRRLALKALELVAKHSGTGGDEFFSLGVTDQLFTLLANASEPDSWEYPRTDESVDFHIALTLLESNSVQAMQTESKERWTLKHLPIIADTLSTTLCLNTDRLGEIGLLVLKLTLNTANNNHAAAIAFIKKGTVRILAHALCDTFQTATKSVDDADIFNGHLESLLLMLGVMINFSEHDLNTGGSLLSTLDDGQAPLDRIIKLFLDHRAATSEADSVEKSELNVAFGYLSLLLGYMSLYEPVRQRLGSMHKAGNLVPLLDSIREFIAYHRMTDDALAQAGEGQAPLYSSFTTKLQGLVERLESCA